MKLLRSPWVTGILVLVALVVVYFQVVAPNLRLGGPAAAPRPAPARAAVSAGPAAAATLAAIEALQPVTPATAALLRPEQPVDTNFVQNHFALWVSSPTRDPFLLLAPEPTAVKTDSVTNSPVPTWTLNAIWSQTGGRMAVINNNVYREGDEIEGYKIVKIQGDEVWFRGSNDVERLGFVRRHPDHRGTQRKKK